MTTGRAAPDLRALVTGASSGIGEAFARALAARGERLVLVARRADRLAKLVGQLGGEGAAAAIPMDLSEPGAAERVKREVARRGMAVDLLVNNAGVGHTGVFHEEPPERIRGMIDLNSRAVAALTRAFLPDMVERGRGRIVNVVSTSAFQPVPYLAIYAASKAFTLSFTEALALELKGTGVRVQALCPGLTATEFQHLAGTDKVLFNRTAAMTPAAVVAASLLALERGRLVVVPGWQNRVTIWLQGFVPRALVRRVAAQLFHPR